MPNYILIHGNFHEIPDDALMHYGVKGMKWGVRRDVRILANHRYNQQKNKIKNSYDAGKIDKNQKNMKLRAAKSMKRDYLSGVQQKYKNAKTDEERESLDNSIMNKAVKEVPNLHIKRGLAVANQALRAAGIASAVVIGGAGAAVSAAAATGLAGAYAVGTAVNVAAETGAAWVGRKLLDVTA